MSSTCSARTTRSTHSSGPAIRRTTAGSRLPPVKLMLQATVRSTWTSTTRSISARTPATSDRRGRSALASNWTINHPGGLAHDPTQEWIKIFGSSSFCCSCSPALAFAGLSDKDKAQGVQKTNSNDLYRPFLINNVFNYYCNNGDGSYNKFSTRQRRVRILQG